MIRIPGRFRFPSPFVFFFIITFLFLSFKMGRGQNILTQRKSSSAKIALHHKCLPVFSQRLSGIPQKTETKKEGCDTYRSMKKQMSLSGLMAELSQGVLFGMIFTGNVSQFI